MWTRRQRYADFPNSQALSEKKGLADTELLWKRKNTAQEYRREQLLLYRIPPEKKSGNEDPKERTHVYRLGAQFFLFPPHCMWEKRGWPNSRVVLFPPFLFLSCAICIHSKRSISAEISEGASVGLTQTHLSWTNGRRRPPLLPPPHKPVYWPEGGQRAKVVRSALSGVAFLSLSLSSSSPLRNCRGR